MSKIERFDSFINEGLPSNISDWLRKAGSEEQSRAAKKVAGWVEKAGSRISGGVSVGRTPQGLVLDIKYQAGEIYVGDEGEIKFNGKPVNSAKELATMLDAYKRSSDENKKYFKIDEAKNNLDDTAIFSALEKSLKGFEFEVNPRQSGDVSIKIKKSMLAVVSVGENGTVVKIGNKSYDATNIKDIIKVIRDNGPFKF